MHFWFGAEDLFGWDQVPGFGGHDVEGEEVDLAEGVTLLTFATAAETAEISSAFSG